MKSGWEEGLQLKAAWAVPLKMTKIKTLRATDGITLRGPRGPKNTFVHTNISRYLTHFAIACVLRQLVDFYIFAEVEDAIIFPRSPDSVPHSHAGANLVHGDLKLIVKILRTISYQSLKRKKILVINFMRLFHGDYNISWLQIL